MESFAERLARVHARITEAAHRAGRAPEQIQLIAVSKTHPPEAVAEAVEAGHYLFGENRVQEAKAKIPETPSQARWHLIGHLQKNKIRQALPLFELIHSVDSLDLARDIQRIAEEQGLRPRVLLEVNLAGEATKFGFKPSTLTAEIESLIALHRLDLEGLMVIPPPASQPDDSRRYFAELRELRDRLERESSLRLPQLSMGMSSDYGVAVEEGATLVRVGSALFGDRSGKTWRPDSPTI